MSGKPYKSGRIDTLADGYRAVLNGRGSPRRRRRIAWSPVIAGSFERRGVPSHTRTCVAGI